MRDRKRIPEFCERLAVVWSKCPDIRFGQLMVDVFGDRDPFYLEDDETIGMIEKWVARNFMEVRE